MFSQLKIKHESLCLLVQVTPHKGFPGGSDGKESACNAGDLGSIPGSGRSSGEGTVNHSTILIFSGKVAGMGLCPISKAAQFIL